MSWVCEFTKDAEKDLRALPRTSQERVARLADEFQINPFQGDVKPLEGAAWKGVFRRRFGNYRLLFTADHQAKKMIVLRILIRSEKTYRA
jgi:mRNA-degrading endonuclease RelE of RelBE toxin-antitoxin system